MKAILFDLDGTLLPMDQDLFVKYYFGALAKKLVPYGYDPESLIQNVWKGTYGMVQNDGKRTNEEVFWEVFSTFYGPNVRNDEPIFQSFYENEFIAGKQACGFTEKAKAVIDELKGKYQLILATNPMFPQVATYRRIGWAGLEVSDFDLVTTYENSHSCKPNLVYYQEILDKFNLDPKDCLMVGNDVSEDMVAAKLGIDVFLVTDCLINKNNEDISKYPNGNFDDLLEYIKNR